MKAAKKILNEELAKHGCRFTDDWETKQYVIDAMESYAQYKVDELNKTDVIKSVCEICESYSGEKKSKTNFCRCCGRRIA